MNALLHEKLKMESVQAGRKMREQARELILRKIYDAARAELDRYLNADKRALAHGLDNLWEKYAGSSCQLERVRAETLKTHNGFLRSVEDVT